jgi:hypothetical protein
MHKDWKFYAVIVAALVIGTAYGSKIPGVKQIADKLP